MKEVSEALGRCRLGGALQTVRDQKGVTALSSVIQRPPDGSHCTALSRAVTPSDPSEDQSSCGLRIDGRHTSRGACPSWEVAVGVQAKEDGGSDQVPMEAKSQQDLLPWGEEGSGRGESGMAPRYLGWFSGRMGCR